METFILLVWSIILLSFLYTALSLAPWVPTKTRDLERIKKLVNLKTWEKFIELGCWDARVSSFIAKGFPHAKIKGIEFSVLPYLAWKIRTLLSKQKNLQVQFWNLYKQNLSEFDVIYFFGFPTTNMILREKLWKELKAWGKIISYTFEIKDWKGKVTKHKENTNELAIYVYEK